MSNLLSLFFYIISFIISTLFYFLYNKHGKRIFIILSFSIPMLIGGLRYNVGTDYYNYLQFYKYGVNVDIGFNIISNITKFFGNYKILFFIYNFLSLLFVFLGLNNIERNKRTLAYFIYLFLFFTIGFNAIRQMLAVSIIFYSYKFIIESKPIGFIFMIILASIFHSSSILILLIYPILKVKNNKIKYLLYIIMIFLVINFEKIIIIISKFQFFEHYEIYSKYIDNYSFNNYSFYFELFIFLLLFIQRKKMFELNKDNLIYWNIYMIGLIFLLTGFINPYVKRISLYFTIASIGLLAVLPFSVNDNKNKLLLYFIVVILCIIKFIISSYVLGQSNIIPYRI